MKNKTSVYLCAQTVVKASVLLTTTGLLALLKASLGRWSYDQMMIKHTHHIHAYTSQYSKNTSKTTNRHIKTSNTCISTLKTHTNIQITNTKYIHMKASLIEISVCLMSFCLSQR